MGIGDWAYNGCISGARFIGEDGAADMANEEHEEMLWTGVDKWNRWRERNPKVKPDLSGANLSRADLSGANLSGTDLNGASLIEAVLTKTSFEKADLRKAFLIDAYLSMAILRNADLQETNLSGAELSGADLSRAKMRRADLSKAVFGKTNLSRADLSEANLENAYLSLAQLSNAILRGANLTEANLSGAILNGADLSASLLIKANLNGAMLNKAILTDANLMRATLIETTFQNAGLSKCRIYGISAWKLNLEGAMQSDLIISDEGEAEITVDNLEIAQFVYMILNNAKIRGVIDTLTTKSVLILGRFTDERKAVLDAIKNELRQRNYVPILFDFEKPASRDLTETIVTLAHLSRFVIADITDAKSIPQELQAIVPNLLSVPIQPIILAAQREYAMFDHFRRYPSVLPLHEYESQGQLIAELPEKVIEPAERKVIELRPKSG